MLCATVPTRGDHPELLEALVASCGIPRERVIVVRTAPDAGVPVGVTVIDDFGDLNIHRWWNRGIDRAVQLGATAVAVLNDDISLAEGALQELERRLDETGAVIATAGPSLRVYSGHRPRMRVLTGSIWVLRASAPVRPDEGFRWFYGDDDLDVRARAAGGVVTVPIAFEHRHAGKATDASPVLLALAEGDRRRYRRLHPLHWSYRRMIERTQGRTGHAVRRMWRRVSGAG